MEVPGKSVAHAEQDLNLICLPCDRDGLKESVFGFCQDCDEHLCETCFKHHRRSRPSRNHVLLGRDEMPKDQKLDTLRPDDKADFCANHRDKTLEFYCKKHRTVACYVCVTLEHKLCQVDYIPDISGSVSDEFRDLTAQMEVLIAKCKTNINNAETATKQIDRNHTKMVEDIKLLRKEINDCLDKIEAEITRKAETVVNAAKQKQENVKITCTEIAEEMNRLQLNLNSLSEGNKQNRLFVEMKNVEGRLSYLTSKKKQVLEENKAEEDVEFIRNQKIIELLNAEKNFGILSAYGVPSADKAVCVHYEGTIDVKKSSSDQTECDISGIVMISHTEMVIADENNKSIKLFDVENATLISEINLSSGPYDVIKLPQNKLAVALLKEKCIQILSVNSTSMSLDRRLGIGASCHGVAYCQDKLVAACDYNPGKVIILNLAGTILKVFDSPGLLRGPEKIVISKDEKSMYVSDYNYTFRSHKSTKMDWQGNKINIFDEGGYKSPYGIQELEDGTFLVCYRDSDTVLRLSSSCKKCEIKGLEKVELYRPRAIAYCERDHKLYVSCVSKKGGASNTMKVFSVKWV